MKLFFFFVWRHFLFYFYFFFYFLFRVDKINLPILKYLIPLYHQDLSIQLICLSVVFSLGSNVKLSFSLLDSNVLFLALSINIQFFNGFINCFDAMILK